MLHSFTVKPVLNGDSKRPQISFQDQLSLNGGQKYCRMLKGEHLATLEHSAILLTSIKLPFVINIFILSSLSGRFTQVLLYYVFLL